MTPAAISAQHSRLAASCGANILAVCQLTTLGFLDVSLGNYREALDTLQPLISGHLAAPAATEVFVAAFVPDAIEALVALDRVDDAESLVETMERNGARLDRPWMLAVGARGRAMVLGAAGDIDEACVACEHALAEHDRLPMPFERARTQLLFGQFLRQQRRKDTAVATLSEALATFEAMGARLWAERATTRTRQNQVRGPSDRRPDTVRASSRRARGEGNDQPRRRGRLVHQPENGRGKLVAYLPQARHPLAGGARQPDEGSPTNRETPDALAGTRVVTSSHGRRVLPRRVVPVRAGKRTPRRDRREAG